MRTPALALLALVACAGSAAATHVPQVILSGNIVSDTSLIPFGWEDERFTTDLGSIYRSPSGNNWICAFNSTYGRRGIITGQGRLFEVAFLAVGGEELPWSTFDEPAIYDSGLDTTNGAYVINDNGDIAISIVERTAPPSRIIIKRVNGLWSTVVRQGQDIPFLPGDEVFGAQLLPIGINPDGSEVSFRANNTVGSLPDTQDDFAILGSTIIQVGVTEVPGVAGRQFTSVGTAANYIRTGVDGSKFIALCDMNGVTADNEFMFTHNGILARENNPFAGLTIRTPASRMGGAAISGNGVHTTFRGQDTSSVDFCAVSGSIAAVRGNPVPGAPAGTTWASFTGFSRTFLNSDVNDQGDWIILGGTVTDAVNTGRIVSSFDGVLLSNRQPVDIDGDGIADDGVYADINGGTGSELSTIVLANDRTVYAVVRLVDSPVPGGGAFLGEALIRIGAPISTCSPCPADFDYNGGIDGGDLGAFFNDFEAGLECADVDGNGGVDGGDLATFFQFFEAGGC